MSRALVLAFTALLLGCATNPVTGEPQLALISEEQEIQLGQETAQQVEQSIGLVDSPALQAYVAKVGDGMAKLSERPTLPWSFKVVDDSAVNAFALPGGPIFVTRGLLTYMNDEAELASVVGHEIGHVTARHSVSQISQQQLAQLGLGIGAAFSERIAQFGELAGAGLKLLFLKNGRDAEREADSLGFRYALADRYDVRAMAEVFETLGRVGGGEGGRLPEWLSTHPNPENRVETAITRAAAVPVDLAKLTRNRDVYLRTIDGLAFGEDPRLGYFADNVFMHPKLRFRAEFPRNWKTQNVPQAVLAVSPGQDAALQLTIENASSPEALLSTLFKQEDVRAGRIERGTIHGLSSATATFEAATQSGTVKGVATAIAHEGRHFLVLGYATTARFETYNDTLRASIGSFDVLRDPEALAVRPAILQVVELKEAMTVAAFHQRFPSSIPVEQLAIANGVRLDETIPAGTLVKRIVGGITPKQPQPATQR